MDGSRFDQLARGMAAGSTRRTLLKSLGGGVIAALGLASPGSLGAAPGPNKPIVFPVDETFPAPNLTNRCGFDVIAHVFGTFTISLRPSGVEFDRIRYQHVFSGPGGSLTVKHIENVKVTATTSPDGTLVETVTATGTLLYHNVVPGHGAIGNNSGREILQFTWQYDEELGEYLLVDFQVLFDAGPNNEVTDADFAVICAELA
jgi:hypothetical protein